MQDTDDVIVAMITSRTKDLASDIPIENSDISEPLPKSSMVRCHRIVTINKNIIEKTISVVNSDFMEKVNTAVGQLINTADQAPLRTAISEQGI